MMGKKLVVGADGSQSLVDTTPGDDAQATADAAAAAISAQATATSQQRKDAFRADANYIAMLAQLKAATPAQVTSYITTNVTDLASARAMLVKLALIVAILANGSS